MKKSEKILLLGLGGTGQYLASRLTRDGHQVTIIERDLTKLRTAEAELDCRLIHGDAKSFDCWQEADAASMDYLIAVTDDDAVNILAAQIGARLGIKEKVVRIRAVEVWKKDALLTAEDFSIDLVIRPEEVAAQEIVKLLRMRVGNAVLDIGDTPLQVVGIHVGRRSPLAQLLIRDLAEKYDDLPFQIACVARDIQTIIPGGDFKILPDDHVFILASRADMAQIMDLTRVSSEAPNRVLIIGGGMIGTRVASLLENTHPVCLLEQREYRAEALSHELTLTECLHGDGSDRETMIQAGLLRTDTVVTATEDCETNIMTAVMAKHLVRTLGDEPRAETAKTIALVQREDYLVLASVMGVDLPVNRKILAANDVLRYIRRGKVLSVVHLHGCDAEVVEMVADEGAPICKASLAEMPVLKNRIMIGAVFQKGHWSLARGGTQISAGDRAVCICNPEDLGELQRLFLS